MRFTIILWILFIGVLGHSQETIYLENPSFEDTPRTGGSSHFDRQIDGWFDCGKIQFKAESPPDIHPTNDHAWGVSKYALDGDTYLGLVVRDNDSWEAVSQRLSSPLKAGQCYSFSILLSTSQMYVSATRRTGKMDNYDDPSVLRIWGSNQFCSYNSYPSELLASSETIINDEWRQFNFKFEPKNDLNFIILQAFYKTPTLIPYNGHILLDGASEIVPIPCDTEVQHDPVLVTNALESKDLQALTERPKETKPKKADFKSPAAGIGIAENVAKPAPRPEKIVEPKPVQQTQKAQSKQNKLAGVSREKIKEGQTLLIDKLYFEPDTNLLKDNSFMILDDIFYFLEDNEDIIVEIQGHTNGNRGITHEYCDALSTSRAKMVASYLANKGIEIDRLKFKGYGKRKPIASNRTLEGRTRNQRVEIKILSIKG